MVKLTECESYEELEKEVLSRGWSSSTLAAFIIQYLKAHHFYKSVLMDEDKAFKRKEVHSWLRLYRDKHNKGNATLSCKELAISYLLDDKSVVEVKRLLEGEGFKVSRTTLYKYKGELKDG